MDRIKTKSDLNKVIVKHSATQQGTTQHDKKQNAK